MVSNSMETLRRWQTKAPQGLGVLSLPVSNYAEAFSALDENGAGVVSPYFQLANTRRVGTGRDTRFILVIMAYKAVFGGVQSDAPFSAAYLNVVDLSNGHDVYPFLLDLAAGDVVDAASIKAAVISYGISQAAIVGITLTSADFVFPHDAVTLPPAPSSYQTIVSQTGTSAPAVSGGLTPMNTYAGSPTFTWARTGAGVYTLTASSAVFNTGGKTAVFVGGLNNLNGSWKAVVTSSTVITLTTAVQSLAVLGLLGFTATPTDALLTQTMVYVQTYP